MSGFHTLFRCCFSEPGLAHVEGIMANPSRKSHEQRGQDLVSPCPVTPSLKAPAGPPRDLTLMDHSQAAAPACPPSQTAPWESLLMEALPFSLAVVNSDGVEVQHQILGSEPAAAQALRQALQQSRHSASTAAEGVQVLVNKQGRSQGRSKHMTAEDVRQTATHASRSACSFLAEDTQGSQERSHQSKHMTAEDTHQAAAHASSSACSFLAALLGPDMADDALSTVHKGRSWKGSIVMRLPCGPPSSSCGPPSSSSQGSLQSGDTKCALF
ncbi:hypothetical protein DUNSADRAFT_14453 [Dunaliella salina]|uniref:Uncharacterized protein n=1 Tax=Dunaliella salina TaxID=3046 RepID=A0ABQ7H9L6_DUNSA|nr:hypothetical protein DUNSADRAFT_14453 [Dunaliella salina]|eukprot:KAF5843537.1 hypothetical protein DUNSADRAFT_14453 [Dunaliella salina]